MEKVAVSVPLVMQSQRFNNNNNNNNNKLHSSG